MDMSADKMYRFGEKRDVQHSNIIFMSGVYSNYKLFFSDNIRDMTDAVLLAQKRVEEEENPEKMAMFNDVHVRQIVSDLFVGKK